MRSSNLPWQISTFCFAFKWKHNAKKNYDTNTKKTRPRILTPVRVVDIKAICILFKITME